MLLLIPLYCPRSIHNNFIGIIVSSLELSVVVLWPSLHLLSAVPVSPLFSLAHSFFGGSFLMTPIAHVFPSVLSVNLPRNG